jgi:SAM-dependent methyltransferase
VDALVEEFLESRREDVRGDVLDLRRETAAAAGVFDARAWRPLQELPSAAYDCVILAQILQHALDPAAMVADCRRILKTGGVLLATVPSLGGIDSILGPDTDVWRFGEEGVRALLGREFEPQAMNVMARGTRSSAIALLGGLAVEDLSPSDFSASPDRCPVLVTARAVAVNDDQEAEWLGSE